MDESRSRRIPNGVSSRFVTPDDEKKRILRVSFLPSGTTGRDVSCIVLPVDTFHPLLLFSANWFDSIKEQSVATLLLSFFFLFFYIRFINKRTFDKETKKGGGEKLNKCIKVVTKVSAKYL